jgi:hypothetical protein
MIEAAVSAPVPAAVSAPTMVMPEMALVPDIKGVCNCDGTLLISSTPRKMARINTKIKRPRDMMFAPLNTSFGILKTVVA